MEAIAAILHADLDAFYASVEQLLDPSLRGKPIAVGGGVVLAASYEAKAFGVRGGMPGRRARELCPQLTFVRGHFKDYQRLGDAAIKVLEDFTPLVERISIDEAFADVAGSVHLFGPPDEIAKAVRRRVRVELGLPISIGVARTKHLAKIASQVAKPDGLVVVDPETELDFLHGLPVELMWGVGPVTKARLAEVGVLTIGQLAKSPRGSLEPLLGHAAGQKLAALAWNRDPRQIRTRIRARSAQASGFRSSGGAVARFSPHEQPVMTAIQLVDLGQPGILAQQIGQSAALKPLTVQPPFAPRRQQAIGDQYEQDLIPARPLTAHAEPLAPELIQLKLPPQQQRQPARAPLPRPAQPQFRQLDADNRGIRQQSFTAVLRKQRQGAAVAPRRPPKPLSNAATPIPEYR